MNIAANQNLSHESESQRQYARIKIPARLILEVNGKIERFQLLDLSAGGFAFESKDVTQNPNGFRGRLEFNVDGFVFMMPISFDIKGTDQAGRLGCSFQNMSYLEVSSLRHIITAYLSGELVTAGDMIAILGRDNFTKERSKKDSHVLEGFDKLKAAIGSVLFFLIGLGAFSFVAVKLWAVLFVVHSSVAVVSSKSYSVTTPREGVINILAAKGEKVKMGQVIGTFSSPLVTFLSANTDLNALNSESIKPFMTQSYLGSLMSPCNCVVESVYAVNGEYLNKGRSVLSLTGESDAPYVSASFPSSDIKYLNIGKEVEVNVAGSAMSGHVERLSVGQDRNGQFLDTVKVLIKTESSALTGLVGMPATVSLSKYELPK